MMLKNAFSHSRDKTRGWDEYSTFCIVPSRSTTSILMTRLKTGMTCYVLYLSIFSPVNFFTGFGIGGLDVGIKYLALFLSTSAFLLLFFLPILGILMAAWFNWICSELLVLFGVAHNFWVDSMIVGLTHVAGVIAQIVIMVWIVTRLVMSKSIVDGA